MDLGLLRAFLAVAEHRHFGQAARALALTQPTLTKQIQTLERRLGGRLFERGRHGARLTDLGTTLLPEARDLVERADALARRMAVLAAGEAGHLTVGFGLSSLELAPRAVAAFRRRHPRTQVTLDDLPSQVQLERLQRGELDVGFVRLPVEEHWGRLPLHTDRLALATAGAETPPAARVSEATGRTELSDPEALAAWVAGRELVQLTRSRGAGLVQQITELCAALGIAPAVRQEARDLQTVLALVAAEVGVAFVPSRAAPIAPPQVTVTPIVHPDATWQVGVVWNRDRIRPLTTNFLAVVQRMHRP